MHAHKVGEGADDLMKFAFFEVLVVVRVKLLVDLIHEEGNVSLGELVAALRVGLPSDIHPINYNELNSYINEMGLAK